MLLWSTGLFGSDEIRMLQSQQFCGSADEMFFVFIQIAVGKIYVLHGCEHCALLLACAALIDEVCIREQIRGSFRLRLCLIQ